jgi:endonuclease/exonuclease/phosphatase family metal-dependent hydrolase
MRKDFVFRMAQGGLVIFVFALAGMASTFQGTTLKVIGWNVESGGANPFIVAQRISAMNGYDVWGLSEVARDADAQIFEIAAEDGEEANFVRIVSRSGGADRLAIIYDADRFQIISYTELGHINTTGTYRAPLVARLKEKETGYEFLFMVNHLARGDEGVRRQQARLLNEWGAYQTLPVVAVGDYNFDWNVTNGAHDQGYDLLTKDGVFTWVRPPQLVKTHCSDFNSVLDFVFLSKSASAWQATSEILFANEICPPPSDKDQSDHRPVMATINMDGMAAMSTSAGAMFK